MTMTYHWEQTNKSELFFLVWGKTGSQEDQADQTNNQSNKGNLSKECSPVHRIKKRLYDKKIYYGGVPVGGILCKNKTYYKEEQMHLILWVLLSWNRMWNSLCWQFALLCPSKHCVRREAFCTTQVLSTQVGTCHAVQGNRWKSSKSHVYFSPIAPYSQCPCSC